MNRHPPWEFIEQLGSVKRVNNPCDSNGRSSNWNSPARPNEGVDLGPLRQGLGEGLDRAQVKLDGPGDGV